VSESGQSYIHRDSDEPCQSEPARDHQSSTVKDAATSSSCRQYEAAEKDRHRSDSSCQQEIVAADDDLVALGEFDQTNDVFDGVQITQDMEPVELATQEPYDMTRHRDPEEIANFDEALDTACDKETHIIDTAELEMTTAFESVESCASAENDIFGSRELFISSKVVADAASDMDVSEQCTTVPSVSSAIGDEHVQDGVMIDDTAYLKDDGVRWSIANQQTDQLCLSHTEADGAWLPCVHSTVSKSELASADESSLGLTSRRDYEEEVQVCCACCVCGTSAWQSAVACL